MKNILLIEDEENLNRGISLKLKKEGYAVFSAACVSEGLKLFQDNTIDLVICDIGLPDGSGLDLCANIRQRSDVLFLFLTALDTEVDVITGYEMGADDYVTKPFTPMELMARVNSQLRRYRRFLEKLVPQENVHVIGGLEINEDTVEVTMDGNPVKLTPIEYKILLLLAKNPGRVFSSEEIYERVWQEKAINTDTIMVHVRNIREKIEIDPKKPKYLKVVWGVGYKLEKQP